MTHVIPRFPGVVKSVTKRLGDAVTKGEVLATVESNESLQTYDIKAELARTVIKRDTTLGEFVSGQEPIFTVTDLSTVWADFSVYRQIFRYCAKVRLLSSRAALGWKRPNKDQLHIALRLGEFADHARARRPAESKRRMASRDFVHGKVITDQAEVPVAVKAGAIQTFRDWDAYSSASGNCPKPCRWNSVAATRSGSRSIGTETWRQLRSRKQFHRKSRHRRPALRMITDFRITPSKEIKL